MGRPGGGTDTEPRSAGAWPSETGARGGSTRGVGGGGGAVHCCQPGVGAQLAEAVVAFALALVGDILVGEAFCGGRCGDPGGAGGGPGDVPGARSTGGHLLGCGNTGTVAEFRSIARGAARSGVPCVTGVPTHSDDGGCCCCSTGPLLPESGGQSAQGTGDVAEDIVAALVGGSTVTEPTQPVAGATLALPPAVGVTAPPPQPATLTLPPVLAAPPEKGVP